MTEVPPAAIPLNLPEKMPRAAITLQEEYELILGQIQAIMVETEFRIREQTIEAKYEIGRTIVTSRYYERYQAESGSVVQKISDDLGINRREVYYCIQFFNQVAELTEGNREEWITSHKGAGKQISWAWIKARLPLKAGEEPPTPPRRKARPKPALEFTGARVGAVWSERDQIKLMFLLGEPVANPDEVEGEYQMEDAQRDIQGERQKKQGTRPAVRDETSAPEEDKWV